MLNLIAQPLPDPTTVSHIPAPAIWVNGRMIQRCAVCGEVLIDKPGPRTMPLPEDTVARTPLSKVGNRRGKSDYEFSEFGGRTPRDLCVLCEPKPKTKQRHVSSGN